MPVFRCGREQSGRLRRNGQNKTQLSCLIERAHYYQHIAVVVAWMRASVSQHQRADITVRRRKIANNCDKCPVTVLL